jgi:uncharacterized membrane protein
VGWFVKLQPAKGGALPSFGELLADMRIGFIPGWGVFGFVLVLYTYLAALMFTGGHVDGEEKYFGVNDNLLHKFSISEVDAAD